MDQLGNVSQAVGNPSLATPKKLDQESHSPHNKQEFPKLIKNSFDFISKNKSKINNSVHAISALSNFLTFLNTNFHFINVDNEILEKISNFWARCCTATRGLTGGIDCTIKNNLVPLIGNALEVPVAAFTSGYLLWLARGIPQSIRQVQGMVKRRNLTIKLQDGKEETVKTDNFAKYGIGMLESMKYSIREIGKITKELFTTPFSKNEEFSHSVLICSAFQFVGPIIAYFGAHKIGAFVRDLFGAFLDIGYILDPQKDPTKPSYLPGGISWIFSAFCDYGKRINYINEKISDLTQLSNTFDAVAGMFESRANFG